MQSKHFLRLAVSGSLVVSMAACVPAMLTKQPATTFSEATNSFIDAAKPSIADYRTDRRATAIRYAITAKLLGNPIQGAGLDDAVLCSPRGEYNYIQANASVLAKVAAYSTELSADSPAEFGKAAKQILKDYKAPEIETDQRSVFVRTENQRCTAEIRDMAGRLYPVDLPWQESGLLAVGTAASTAWELLKPVLTALAREIDEQRRAQILAAFFKKQENVDLLKKAIAAMDGEVKWQTGVRRALALNAALTATEELRLSVAGVDLTATSCNAWQSKGGTDSDEPLARRAPEFRLCFKKVFDGVEAKAEAFLKKAVAYDVEADKVFDSGAQKLTVALEKLKTIADGDAPTEDYLKALYETAVKWAEIAEQVKKTAESDEVKQSVENVMKALRAGL